MEVKVRESRLELVEGDITNQEVDGIVNAARSSLLGGGGVDGAIHRAAGKKLVEYCRTLGGCSPGEAKITPGFQLPASHVIHTVGPVYRESGMDAPKVLARCYENSLSLARDNGLKSIAFPSISTGAYGYPVREASRIALETIIAFLEKHSEVEVVRMVLFGRADFDVYRETLEKLSADLENR